MKRGFDVSNFNPGVNFAEAKADGYDFCYILMTDGQAQTSGDMFRNHLAMTQVKACEAAGIAWGGYHFFRPTKDAIGTPNPQATQAAFFLQYLKEMPGTPTLPPAIDVETEDPNGWQHLASTSIEFCQLVETALVIPSCMYYSNVSFAKNLPGWPFHRHIWLADPTNAGPNLPRTIRQFAPGPLPGSPKDVDIDEFVGLTLQWAVLTGQIPAQGTISHPSSTSTKEVTTMSIAIGSDGKIHVERVSPQGHLLVFSQTPAQKDGWTVADVTDAVQAESGQTYTVQP